MGLFETQELDDLDLLLYGQPDDDTDLESSEIICRCGQGRGRGVERSVPRLPQAAIHHRIALMEVRYQVSEGQGRGRGWRDQCPDYHRLPFITE